MPLPSPALPFAGCVPATTYHLALLFEPCCARSSSGSLSRAEFKAILTRVTGQALSDEDAEHLLNHFDADGNGELSIDEFVKTVGLYEME